jgi:hypothetical protein
MEMGMVMSPSTANTGSGITSVRYRCVWATVTAKGHNPFVSLSNQIPVMSHPRRLELSMSMNQTWRSIN